MAEQVVGFLQQFLEVFPTLGGKKLYLAGESVREPDYVLELMLTKYTVRWHVRAL